MTEAVLFDIDGTLLVTGGAGAVAWQRAFREVIGRDGGEPNPTFDLDLKGQKATLRIRRASRKAPQQAIVAGP